MLSGSLRCIPQSWCSLRTVYFVMQFSFSIFSFQGAVNRKEVRRHVSAVFTKGEIPEQSSTAFAVVISQSDMYDSRLIDYFFLEDISPVEVWGFEPQAPCVQGRCSPAELYPHFNGARPHTPSRQLTFSLHLGGDFIAFHAVFLPLAESL